MRSVGARLEPGTRVEPAERQRLAGVARRVRPLLEEVQELRGQPGQRQEVEPVVFERRRQRTRVPRSNELEVAPGNLESRHIALPARAQHVAFEREQRTARFAVPSPESPRWMQHVDMRQRRAGRCQSMKQVAGLEHRRVE